MTTFDDINYFKTFYNNNYLVMCIGETHTREKCPKSKLHDIFNLEYILNIVYNYIDSPAKVNLYIECPELDYNSLVTKGTLFDYCNTQHIGEKFNFNIIRIDERHIDFNNNILYIYYHNFVLNNIPTEDECIDKYYSEENFDLLNTYFNNFIHSKPISPPEPNVFVDIINKLFENFNTVLRPILINLKIKKTSLDSENKRINKNKKRRETLFRNQTHQNYNNQLLNISSRYNNIENQLSKNNTDQTELKTEIINYSIHFRDFIRALWLNALDHNIYYNLTKNYEKNTVNIIYTGSDHSINLERLFQVTKGWIIDEIGVNRSTNCTSIDIPRLKHRLNSFNADYVPVYPPVGWLSRSPPVGLLHNSPPVYPLLSNFSKSRGRASSPPVGRLHKSPRVSPPRPDYSNPPKRSKRGRGQTNSRRLS
jgi:hypothetical protein